MQAKEPHPYQAWDDEIDLRQLIESIWRWRWLVVGLVVAAVAVTAVISYVVLPPRYESSITLDLVVLQAEELRLDPVVYQTLATSNRVWEHMVQRGSLDMTPAQLQEAVTVTLDRNSRLLSATTSAQSPVEAQRLAFLWYEVFTTELAAYARETVGQLQAAAERDLVELERRASAARDELNAFDSKVDLPLLETRLARLQEELVEAEARLRQLTLNAIPADEARLRAIETALADQPETLGQNAYGIVFPAMDGQAGVTADVASLNPIHVQLNLDLVATQTRLATNRRSAELLQEQLAQLPREIERLRIDLVAYREERSRLEREVNTLEMLVEEARARRDSLLRLQRRVEDVVVPTVVADPVLPSAPVAPRKLLNMVLAGFLAAFVGIGVALFIEFWSAGQAKR